MVDNPDTNVYRLVHGEGDGMPGLIIDFYNGTAVMQAHSAGMYVIRETIAKALKEVMGDRLVAVYDKSEKTVPFKRAGLFFVTEKKLKILRGINDSLPMAAASGIKFDNYYLSII